MDDLISRKEAIEAIRNGFIGDDSCVESPEECNEMLEWAIETLEVIPSAQPNLQPTCNLASDCVSRQAAIDSICRTVCDNPEICESPCDEIKVLEIIPSAQPEMPEWAQKVEEYRKSAPSHIHNPLAWALYQTWKEYDR